MDVVQIIANYGFPILACCVMGLYIKSITESHKNEIKEITQSHKSETNTLSKAIENNTIAITKLCEKLEAYSNDGK